MAVKFNDFTYIAKCLLKTRIHLNHRQFSDFTIEELNDYAGCIYDLGNKYHIWFKKFYLNRIEKAFAFGITANPYGYPPTGPDDIMKWEYFSAFLEYLFNVSGAEKFECLVRVTNPYLSKRGKQELNDFAKNFCDCIFYDLWGLFNQHKIVKQKIVDYFCEVGILKKRENGVERVGWCDYGIGY